MLFAFAGWQNALSQTFTFEGLNYNVTSSTTVEVGDNGGAIGAVAIPSNVTYDSSNYSVTSISVFAFAFNSNLISVTIPDSITSIGGLSFLGCTSLTTFTIPDSVTSIGDNAFEGCNGLSSVTIGNSVTSIGGRAFESCSGLTSLTIGNSVTTIGDNTFYVCSGLTSLIIPNSVTSIGYGAFAFCSGLRTVTIPSSINSIDQAAFYNCSGLTSLTCNIETPLSINPNVFDGINKSTCSLTVPTASVSAYKTAAVWQNFAPITCASPIENITSITACGSYTWTNTGETYTQSGIYTGTTTNCVTEQLDLIITTPSFNTTTQSACGSYTWSNNGKTYTESGIYTGTSTNCVTEQLDLIITTPSFNTTTQSACGSYTWTNTGETYTESGIYTGTTTNCVTEVLNLTITTPPTSFSSDGINYVVTSPTTVAVGNNSGASGNKVIPATVTTSCATYAVTSIVDGAFQNCTGLTEVTIPDSVISISEYAFYGCSGLTSVIIPNSVISIGSSAFYNCSGLTSITIGNSVTTIGDNAFQRCTGLSSVTIPNSVTNIGNDTFENCRNLTSVTIPNSVTSIGSAAFGHTGLKSITIPNSITTINAFAFAYCKNLTTVTIPNSVTSIRDAAFFECTGLTSLTCNIETPLSINSNVFSNVNQSTCSLTVPAGSITAYQSAAVWQNFAPITCASPTENATAITSCGSYTWTNTGETFTQSGIYTGTTTNCVTEQLDLIITTPPFNTTTQSACGSYFWSNTGETFTQSGIYTGTTTNCVTEQLDLIITTPSFNTTTQSACGSYTWSNNGKTYTESGIYTGTTTNCVTEQLDLIITTPPFNTTTQSACGSYTWTNTGETFTQSGIYTGTTTNCVTEQLDLTITTPTTNFTSEGINYVVTSPTTVAVGNNSGASGNKVIPASVTTSCATYAVTSIVDGAFQNCTGLTSVTIPNSISTISNANFSGCTGLTSVTIPNSIITIGSGAFNSCSSLSSVSIPDSVTNIGISAFNSCSRLTSVTIPNAITSISNSVFERCVGLESVSIPSSVSNIGNSSFSGCISLSSITIPDSVTTIGESAFLRCTVLESVTIPNLVSSINSSTFAYCSGLTSVIIPNSVTSIGYGAFAFCSGLRTVTIPSSINSIDQAAFYNCSGLTSVQCNVAAPLSINPNVFAVVNQSACSLIVPAGSITAYQSAAVWQNFAPITCANPTENITSITACDSYTWANNSQTYTASGTYTGTTTNCVTEVLNLTINTSGLQTTFISGGINYVVTSATTVAVGNNIGARGNISIPAAVTTSCGTFTVTSISASAFQACSGLTQVTIPESITIIGALAFRDCSSLTSLIIPNSVISINPGAFYGCTGLTSVIISNSLTSIGSQLFYNCIGLTSVIIPSSVITINNGAFRGCIGLTSLIMPSSVSSIGNGAFRSCNNLTSVTIPSSVTSMGIDVFYDCVNLTSVICNIISPLVINANVFQNVNQGACSLTVPAGSFAAYQVATIWRDFSPINCSGSLINSTTISACDTYTWSNTGQTYITSGTYTGTTTNCVTEVLNLTIIPSSDNNTAITACGSYTWANNNQNYSESGIYRGTTTNCVTEVLNLTINPLSSVPNLSLLDQQCKTTSGYLGLQNQSQTFTAGASGNLDKISLYLGNPNGDASETNLTVQVYEGSGTTGTLLGSQTYTYPAQWGFQNTDFNFSNISVVKGQVYTFKLSAPSVSNGFIGINTDNTYSGGSLDFAPSSDMIFKTYVNRSNQSFCQGTTLNDLKADGTNVSWYNAAIGGNQLTNAALLETGTYFASQTENTCESERNAVTVLVNPTTAITSQPAASFICSTIGSTSTFSVESNAVNPSYTWQYRVATTANSNPDWITITSANAAVYANFNTANLTVTKTTTLPATGTQYRVLVSGTCGDTLSDVAPLSILSTVKAGTISSTASVCIGSDITLTLGSYAGSSFQWQSAATATGEFANIQGATGTTYTILGATATVDKSYRVIVTNSCNTTTATSAIKTLKVDPTSVAGTVKGGGIICSGSNATLSVAGNTGIIQWQYSLDGMEYKTAPYWKTVAGVPTFFNPDNATEFSTMVSTGIAATYIASNISADTYFRAKIKSGLCSEAYSNAVQFMIGTDASSGTLTAADATVCSGTGTTLTLAGSVGTIKWFKSTNWTIASPTWTAVTTSTAGTLATGNLTASTAYKAEVSIGSCSTLTTEVVPVLVYAAPLAKTITATVSSPTGATSLLAICTTSSTSKVLTIGAGSNGAIQWQKSTTSTTTGFADIADATTTSYTVANPAVGVNYFRAKFTNSCGAAVYSAAFTVYYKNCAVLAKMTEAKVIPAVAVVPFDVMAYPNPFSTNFNLEVITTSSENVAVNVYDALGKLVETRNVPVSEVGSQEVGTNYPTGTYTIMVVQGENVKTLRVIKR